MFLTGENFSDIRSLCLTDYANFLRVRKRNYEKATRFYNMAIRLKPENHYAYAGLASVQVEKQMFTEALESCNKAISIKPTGQCFILQNLIYKLLRDNFGAEKAVQEALKFFDNNLAVVYNQIAYISREFKLYDTSEYYCKELIKKYPEEAGAHFNLASIYLVKGQLQDAKSEFLSGLGLTTDKRYRKYAEKEIRILERKIKSREEAKEDRHYCYSFLGRK